jgi:tetratricopeptide (TPR) repeat protein
LKTRKTYRPAKPALLKYIHTFFVFLLIVGTSCSTTKNTSTTRAYHNLTAHYNVYFNANESLKSGIRKLKKNNEDYSRLLPVFRYEDKSALSALSSEMDITITKCAKTIKSHSITVKPKFDKKTLTQKEKQFLAKPEYCKWIDDAYLIMGKAHFYKQDFETAKQTFLQNINKYHMEPSKEEAMLWLAKTFAETGEYKNADDLLGELRKLKRWDQYFLHEIELLQASMFLKQKDYNNAAQKLKTALTYKHKKKDKPRFYFILAQIFQKNEQYTPAIEYYKKVIKKNPNYDISFKSKINLAEIYEKTGADAVELKQQFLKMLKDEKNIDYYDQLYYALAKIEQNQKNIEKAIEYYRLSASSKSSNKTQKIKTYLALADFYFSTNQHGLAEAYYDSTASMIDPQFPDYETIFPDVQARRLLSKNLNTVITEDSLQLVAKLPEAERNSRIDAIIQKIREEEQKKQLASQNAGPDPYLMDDNYYNNRNTDPGKGANYYFYNPNNVSAGQTDFKKRWGDRKLEDNWRRSNKQATMDETLIAENDEKQSGQDANKKENRFTDIKSRDYYLQNIPLTPEKLTESNKKIESALLNSGNIYLRDFNNKQKAVWQYETLLNRFPNSESKQDILEKIHTIYDSDADYSQAEKYKQLIIKEFPESFYAKLLSDPAFIQKTKKEQAEIEKIYQTAYQRYQSKAYSEALGYCEHGLKTFPGSYLEPRFIFLKAIVLGESGSKDEMKKNLEFLVLKFPEHDVAQAAAPMLEILNGKKLEQEIYFTSPDSMHFFSVVFPKEKMDKNKLRFKFIAFNAREYTQEDLNISIQELDISRDLLIIRAFKNSKSAFAYYLKVKESGLMQEFSALSPVDFIISSSNFQTYLKNRDSFKYLRFFEENYLKGL